MIHDVLAIATATVCMAAVLFGPWVVFGWFVTGKVCRVVGHRPRLVTEPVGEYVTVGTTWRRVGGKVMGELMEIPKQQFVPSGLPDRHVVRCRFCDTEFDS